MNLFIKNTQCIVIPEFLESQRSTIEILLMGPKAL